ncbi:hypothetical protein C0J45_2599 [Silurus meridionalis]|uniref:Uncharacterized protein n=1 Tax=Silurus meridionalis TaxID=175797 RepID=A0A8T0BPU3_SILME|nr:hypothetical protein HF521_016182 [Silurus meridionalis]KAI5106961.1 hypothetical protein C0J45_2599 [Silurus meridionalis]
MTHGCARRFAALMSAYALRPAGSVMFELAGELFLKEHNKSGSDAIERQKPKYLAYQIDTLLKELNPKFKQEMKLSLKFPLTLQHRPNLTYSPNSHTSLAVHQIPNALQAKSGLLKTGRA